MSGINAPGAALPQQAPACSDDAGIFQADVIRLREIAREDRTIVEQQGDAVFGVTRRVQDLPGDADALQQRPAPGA